MNPKMSHKILSAMLTLCMLLTSVSVAFSIGAGAVTDLDSGLIGHWTFDGEESNADTVANTVETEGENRYDASLTGGTSIIANGTLSGGMLHMDGSNSTYMSIPGIINSQTQDFSISLWLNMDETINEGRSDNINILQQTGGGKTLLFYKIPDQGLKLEVFMNGEHHEVDFVPTLGTWHNIILTSVADSDSVNLYIDGESMFSGTVNGIDGLTDLLIGCHKDGGLSYKGDIDEVRYYDRSISAEEAAEIYNLNKAGADDPVLDVDTDLVGYWNFDNDTGTNVANKAAAEDAENSYDGVLEGSASITENGTLSGGMMSLNGTNGSHLKVPGIINSGTNSFSVSLWLKLDESLLSGHNGNISIVQQSGDGRTILLYRTNSVLGTYMNGHNVDSSESFPELPGDWHHLVITSDVNTHQVKIYLDAQEVMSSEVISDCSDTTDLLIGSHKNGGDVVNGDIDEIRYYSRAITLEEIEGIYTLSGGILGINNLRSAISTANSLLEAGILEETAAESVQLSDAVESAQAALNKQGVTSEEIVAATNELLEKIGAYRAAVNKLPVTVTVDPDAVINTLSDGYFGVNHRYYENAIQSWDPEKKAIREEFDNYMKDASFGSVRYPGGTVGNLVHWKETIGDTENRVNQPHGFYFWQNQAIVPNFGLDEAATYIIDELGAEMIYMYGIGRGTAEDAADLVEYLNCEVGENPNGGTDWAQVRADNGHPEPYGVTNFEIGNEPNSDWYQTYWLNGRASGRSLIDAYVYGSKGKDGTSSDANAFTFTAGGNENEFAATYVSDKDNWNASARFSNGQPNQVKYVKFAPIVPGSLTLTVGGTEWTKVETLEGEGARNVYTLDETTGEINFGDGTNGNIPENNAEILVSYKKVADGLVDYYEAMKAVDPDIKIYASIHTNDFINFLQTNNEDRWDGVVCHPYTKQGGLFADNDPLFYEKIMERGETVIDSDIENIAQYLINHGFEDKKITISEYGIYNSQNYLLQTQTNALYNAKALFAMSKIEEIAYSNRHSLNDFIEGNNYGPGQQAVIQVFESDGTYRFVSTPSARLFEMFGNMTGDMVIQDSISRKVEFYNNVSAISTMSTKDEFGNIYLGILNLSKTDAQQVIYDVNGVDFTGKTVEVWTLAGDSYDAVNTLENPDAVDIVKSQLTSDAENLTISIPAHAVVMIKVASEFMFGDVNHDENIDASDATLVLQRYAGIIGDDYKDYDPTLADLDGKDGVNSMDATLILQKYAGIITTFPIEKAADIKTD